jgi:hypothetical protein
MQHVRSWNDLEPFGIVPLTGESCGLAYRILFDLTERGGRIVGRCFGIGDMKLAPPWNGGSADDPHVGSIMFAPEALTPIAVFALLDAGCQEVWLMKEEVIGIESADEIPRGREVYRPRRALRAAGTAGDRNVHVFTGRLE